MQSISERTLVKVILLAVFTVILSACGGGSSGGGSSPNPVTPTPTPSPTPSPEPSPTPTPEPTPAQDYTLIIDSQQRYQEIAGFGAALPMWTTNRLTTGEVRTLVGTGENELGLSILRTIIDPDPNAWSRAVNSLAEAKVYGEGVQILASPWSPPAHMKSNNSTTDGGKLLLEYYDDYAQHLNSYVDYMANQGISIDVISVQNEPDWHPSYESCDWSGEELRNFVRDHGGTVQAKLLVGESLRFNRAYTDPSLNDEMALEQFEYVGGHLYDAQNSGNFTAYPLAEEKGKQRWMTEWLIHKADGDGAAIWGDANADVWDETLDEVMASVHQSMDVNWNAYIWWWARRFYSLIGDGEAAYGTERGAVLKRGWAFSHYARYVRSGYTRIGASTEHAGVYVTAYEGENEMVVVVLNRAEEELNSVEIETAESIQTAKAVVTSLTDNHTSLDIMIESGQAKLPNLPARSVVTVVLTFSL